MHPILQSAPIVLCVVVTSALLLQILVQHIYPAKLRRDHTALGGAIFSVIGTTYAVLLAFMAMAAWEKYSTAKALAQHEANLIAGIFHVSEGVSAPAGTEIRSDVSAYLARIIEFEWPAQIAGRQVPIVDPLLVRLDQLVVGMVPAGAREANVQQYMLGALSDVETSRRDRRLAASGTIPDLVWIVLLSGGVLMVGFSFMLGGASLPVHMAMTTALVASGVLILLLVAGLSSPFQGAVTISPDAYVVVLAEIRGSS